MAEERRGNRRSSLFSKALHLAGKSAGDRASGNGRGAEPAVSGPELVTRQQRDRDDRDRELDLLRKLRPDAPRSPGNDAVADVPVGGVKNRSVPDQTALGPDLGFRFETATGASGPDQADFLASGFIPTVVLDYQESRAFERAYQVSLGPAAMDRETLMQGDPTPVISLAPEVETAAMRFANGDFAGAETSLVGAVGVGDDADDVNTWLALLDYYQATNQPEKFKARANALMRTGRTPLGWLVLDDQAEAHVSVHSGSGDTDVDWVGLELRGELVGDITDALIPLADFGQIQVIQLNCRALRRVDFGAATELARWILHQAERGRRVVFVEVNWLVAALFDMLGVSDSAWVMRRVE